MKSIIQLIVVSCVFIIIGCSARYTKQFVADDNEVKESYLIKEHGWTLRIPELSAFKEVKDVSSISDTNKYWLTIHSYYPIDDHQETKRDFQIDSVMFINYIKDTSKYEKLLLSKDKEILDKIFKLTYTKKKNFNKTIGEYFQQFPFVENKILTRIDSLQVPADTIWTIPSRKAPFMDSNKDNFHVAYNFFDTNFVKIYDNVLKVELVFEYTIIDDSGNEVKKDTLTCFMNRDDSAKDLPFFLE